MKILRYFKLLQAFFIYNLKGDLEFRGNIIFWTFNNFLWLAILVTGINLIFGQVMTIASWNRNEVFLILFITSLFHDLLWTFLFRNLSAFPSLVRQGSLDYVLLKPVNSRFLISFKILEFDHYLRIFVDLYLIYRYTILTAGGIYFTNLISFIFLFLASLIIFYSLFFAITMFNIWFTNLGNLVELFHDLKDLGGKPVYIFKRNLLYFFSFILPVGFIGTFPAEALMGRVSLLKIIIAPVLAVFFYWSSGRFFRFALKHYSSASS